MRTPAFAALAAFAVILGVRAQPAACPPVGDIATLVRCAQESSETVVRSRADVQAAEARRTVASRFLPANPTLEGGLGRRTADTGEVDLDRGFELSQQFEIGGQRGARIDSAEAELRGERAVAEAAERVVAANVLLACTQVVRLRRALMLAGEQRHAADRLVEVSRARSQKGVGAAIDSELAEAARVQALRDERAVAQDLAEAEGALLITVGTDTALVPESALPEGPQPSGALADLEESAASRQPQVVAARSELESARARIDLLRRERIPDITVGGGWRHEEFADIWSARLTVPLPLFRRNQGEIAEQEARTAQATMNARQAGLRARVSVRNAYRSWERARAAAAAVGGDLDQRLRADVQALQLAYERGTMQLPAVLASLREAQAARRTVLDAQADAVQAALELARAAGLSPCPAGGCR